MTAKFDVLLIMARVVGVPGVAGWSAGVLESGVRITTGFNFSGIVR